jgi:nucleobase:cation symporter-1, NCS1 family
MSNSSAEDQATYGVERHSIDYVSSAERHGDVRDQGPFWFTVNFQFMSVSLGFVGPAMGLSLGWTTLAAALGIIVGTIFMAFHATQGPIMGLPQMVQSRAQFGYRGVILPLSATLVNFIGFNVVCALLMMGGLHDLFGWDRYAALIAIAILSALLAFYGYDWMHLVVKILFWTSMPLFTILSVAIAIGLIPHGPVHQLHFNGVAFGVEFATCASYNLQLAVYVSDYSRYLKRDTPAAQIVGFVFIGAISSAIWLIALGAWLTTRLGLADPMIAISRAGNELFSGFGTIIVIDSVLLMFAMIAMTSYSGMLTLATWLDSLRPVTPTLTIRAVLIGVITLLWVGATLAAGENAINALMLLLTILLYLLVPWTAVNLVDYFFVRHGHYAIKDLFRADGIYGSWGWRGLLAYILGWIVIVPFAALPGIYVGPIAKKMHGIDIAWLISLASAGLFYYLASLSFSPESEQAAIAASELDLEGPLRTPSHAIEREESQPLDGQVAEIIAIR